MKPKIKIDRPLVSSDKPATGQFGQVSESVWQTSLNSSPAWLRSRLFESRPRTWWVKRRLRCSISSARLI
jgi:hypothetical protein